MDDSMRLRELNFLWLKLKPYLDDAIDEDWDFSNVDALHFNYSIFSIRMDSLNRYLETKNSSLGEQIGGKKNV